MSKACQNCGEELTPKGRCLTSDCNPRMYDSWMSKDGTYEDEF